MVQNMFDWIPQILHTTTLREQQRARVININAPLAFMENVIYCESKGHCFKMCCRCVCGVYVRFVTGRLLCVCNEKCFL